MIKKGVFFFDKKPFIVNPWTKLINIDTKSISSLPICIQLQEIDIKHWGIESLSEIGSLVGIPTKTDEQTREKSMLSYARLLVEMDLKGAFPDTVDFTKEKGLMIK